MWKSPGKNTGEGCMPFSKGIFFTISATREVSSLKAKVRLQEHEQKRGNLGLILKFRNDSFGKGLLKI